MKKFVLKPKGTALWLKLKTTLSPEQIIEFCDIDMFVFDSINFMNTVQFDPIEAGQLNVDEIEKGEKDPNYKLKNILKMESFTKKITRKYVSFKNRGERRNGAIAFLLKNYPTLEKKDIARLMGTTSKIVNDIDNLLNSDKAENINMIDPIYEEIVTKKEIDDILMKQTKKNIRILKKQSKTIQDNQSL